MEHRNWEKKICVKINLYKGCWVEEVIYYQYALPLRIVERWQWYFEYLAALVKVHNPRRKVELVICAQEYNSVEDYISERTKNLLRAKKVKLKRTRTGIEDDLFGFAKAEREKLTDKVQREIEALERGEINFYVPPEYINKIKKWIK